MMRVGTDIVHIPNFKERLEKNRWKFERDVFFKGELGNGLPEHLAGVFAAKEAAIKALGLAPGRWKSAEIKKFDSGKPTLILKDDIKSKAESCDVSISHAGDYAIAIVVCSY